MKIKYLPAIKISVFFIASTFALSACQVDSYNDLAPHISEYNTHAALRLNEKRR